MDHVKLLRNHFAEVLAGIGFHERYFTYCDAHRRRGNHSALRKDDFAEAMTRTPLSFRYRRSENFFQHIEKHERIEIGLHVSFRWNLLVELILVAEIDDVYLGSLFPRVATAVAKAKDPGFDPGRHEMGIRATNREELADTLAFVSELYRDTRAAVLSHDWPTS